MHGINGEIDDDSVKIKGPRIQIGRGSATTLYLFSYLYGINRDDIFTVQGKL